jgi:ABC-type sugar transport system ATPase subunit
MAFFEVEDIRKRINTEFELGPLSFAIDAGSRWAIAGATGSGKSTLMKMMAGLVQADAGTILFDGSRVRGPEEKLLPGHSRIAYLSQHFELRHHYRVSELLEYANKLPYREALWIYAVCRITHLLDRKEHELSGGEKQRVATARLLIQQPALLLLDEPFSNLDRHHKGVMQSVIEDIGTELGITCVLVTHDPLDSLSWAENILVLQEGSCVQSGNPAELYAKPVSAYVAGLFGPYNLLTERQVATFAARVALPATALGIGVRPECLHLRAATEAGAPGTLQRLYFYGSHYEADVLVAGDPLRVRVNAPQWEAGQTVSVAIDADRVWFV